MKKLLLGWVAFMLLMVVLAMPRFVRFPEDTAVTIYSAEKSVPLAAEDAADLIGRLNQYYFWDGQDGYYCDCVSEFTLTIGEDRLICAGGHFHWDERELTLNMNEEDAREVKWLAGQYLYRE